VSGGGAGLAGCAGWVGWSGAQAAREPPTTLAVIAAKNSRRGIGDTIVSVSYAVGQIPLLAVFPGDRGRNDANLFGLFGFARRKLRINFREPGCGNGAASRGEWR
jgi:hypothetical protein